MCLIAFALDAHPRYSLVLIANRDEYRRRETRPACFWPEAPQVLAGRDCQAGGTWLGLTAAGKLAAVTNYRDVRQQVSDPPSRGTLVAGYLCDDAMTTDDLQGHLMTCGERYDGFNLLYGSCCELHYFTNRGGSSGPVKAGIHALSNHLLDTGWPKVVAARERLDVCLQRPELNPLQLLDLLADPTPFADNLLPDTGIGPEYERLLSPLFITGDLYATRSTSVILIGRDGIVDFMERSHDTPDLPPRRFSFHLSTDALP